MIPRVVTLLLFLFVVLRSSPMTPRQLPATEKRALEMGLAAVKN
jgi:hypothetical protein